MTKRELDYSIDSKIDINALDIEWINHSDIERQYIEQVGRMKRRVIRATEKNKLAHEEVKSTRSKLIQKCHNHPEKCIGKEKATDKQAEAYYRTHPNYLSKKRKMIKAETRLMEAEEEHTSAVSMKDLMHFTKTKALEELVNLHGQGYFAGPSVPRNIDREILKKRSREEKDTRRSKKIGSGMKRNA